jgi:hypothetical protein
MLPHQLIRLVLVASTASLDGTLSPALRAEADECNAATPDSGREAVDDVLQDAQRESPPPMQVGDELPDDLEDWQLSYVREAEALPD